LKERGMVMFKAKFRPTAKLAASARLQAQQQQQPQARAPRVQQQQQQQEQQTPQTPKVPPIEEERGPQAPVREPEPRHEPERALNERA
jgi:glucose/arabinose dehydrogenase